MECRDTETLLLLRAVKWRNKGNISWEIFISWEIKAGCPGGGLDFVGQAGEGHARTLSEGLL